MKRLLAFTGGMCMLGAFCVAFAPPAAWNNTIAIDAAVLETTDTPTDTATAFDTESFFVAVGKLGSDIELRYFCYDAANEDYTVERIAWDKAPWNCEYGDVFAAEGEVSMTKHETVPGDKTYADAYHYTLDENTVLKKVGECNDLMDIQELTVTKQSYDGSGHWTVSLEDSDGSKYDYGFNSVGSLYGINLAEDVQPGDACGFALCRDRVVIPLNIGSDNYILYGDIQYNPFSQNTEIGIYAGGTFDFSNVQLKAVYYNWWQFKPFSVCSFTIGSGDFADMYTLDTSQVDTNTPGEYTVFIRPIAGKVASFPNQSSYKDLRMKGNVSSFTVKVYDKNENTDKPLYLRCYSEYIEVHCGEGTLIPLVGAYPATVSCEIEDGTIAKADVDNPSKPEYIDFVGLKEGETTVTVRTSDGRTTTEKIRVLPPKTTETQPLVTSTTGSWNGQTTTTTTTTTTKPDPATTTTKWWYQYETTTTTTTTTAVWSSTTTTTTTTNTTASSDIVNAAWGDANEDGSVTVSDAVLIARITASDKKAGITEKGRQNADVTADGAIDEKDLVQVLKYLAKNVS